MITGAQVRMARGHLRWSVDDLAEKAGVSPAAVKRMEEVDDTPSVFADDLAQVQKALESAGVEFIAEDGGGPGVRLRKGGPLSDAAAAIPVEELNASNDE
jgi:transcriptional regulator with XRE-family HTH domain